MIPTSFLDELEKIAAGPFIIEVDDPSIGGRFIPRDSFMELMEARPEIRATYQEEFPEILKSKKDVVFVPSKKALSEAGIPDKNIDPMYRAYRRHELAHWSRARKGKMKGYGEPGLRNVLRSVREEVVGYGSMGKHLPKDMERDLAKKFLPITTASVQQAYAPKGGVKKAILGGSLSKPARIARKLLRR